MPLQGHEGQYVVNKAIMYCVEAPGAVCRQPVIINGHAVDVKAAAHSWFWQACRNRYTAPSTHSAHLEPCIPPCTSVKTGFALESIQLFYLHLLTQTACMQLHTSKQIPHSHCTDHCGCANEALLNRLTSWTEFNFNICLMPTPILKVVPKARHFLP